MRSAGKTRALADSLGVDVRALRGKAIVFRNGSEIRAIAVDEADELRGFGSAIAFGEPSFGWVKHCYLQSH